MNPLLIGPLPLPVNGCSYANAVLVRRASTVAEFDCIDTNADGISGRQGESFSLRKALAFLSTYLGLPRVVTAGVVYLTPGQTFFGLLKYAPFMVLARLLGRPYVIHVHGNHLGAHYAGLKGFKRHIFWFFVAGAAAGIVLSESLRANFIGLLPPGRVFVVENFAGDDLFATPSARKATDKLRILYLSNLMREKGILELLDALLLLKRGGVAFEATVAGQMEIGIEAEVRERLNLLGECAHYVGTVAGAEKRRLLDAANVFALPTTYAMEGQPISLLEALATGNIVVSTAHAGIPDVVDARNGYLLLERKAELVAEVLASIAADMRGHVERFAAYNVSYAAARFTEQRFADGVLSVLRLVSERTETTAGAGSA